MSIQVLKPKYQTQEVLDSIKECLDKQWTGMGYKTTEFEQAWKDYTNVNNAHFVHSCTAALHIALNVFKNTDLWLDGDEVITSPLTFVSTNHVIKYENLKPVFADVDDTLCLDPESVEQLITNKTQAVIYVGLGGNTGNYLQIKELCEKYELKLILDGAHMAGTRVREFAPDGSAFTHWHVGRDADAACFSFQTVKNLPTADGGMVCFKEEEHDKLARQLSWLGIDKDTFSRTLPDGSYKWKYDVPNVGFKYHGNSIMAAIGLVQLKYLDEENEKRNTIADLYDWKIKNSFVNDVELINVPNQCYKNSRHLYQILVAPELRDDIINTMYNNDIYPGVHYITNTEYPMYAYGKLTTPIATKYSNRLITLPIHMDITPDDVEKVVMVLRRFFT